MTKQDKETAILFGLIELYIKMGEPIGSNSLREKGFEYMSSATIRNYFAKLEENGLLAQQHASGGRIPTPKAFHLYARHHLNDPLFDKKDEDLLKNGLKIQGSEIAGYLSQAAEVLSQITKCAVFQSFPRFDQDFIRDIKLIKLDDKKILSIIITDFGLVKTETLISPKELSNQNVLQIEECFAWMLHKQEKPKVANPIIKLAQHFFNEVMVRYVADYSSFSNEEIYRCGLSHLLNYSEFSDMSILANSLSLFEDKEKMHSILKKCYENNTLSFLIGEELKTFNVPAQDVAILTIPYHINQITVGATALLGPIRLPYRKIFGQLNLYSKYVSEALTQTVYKHKITFREPQDAQVASTYKRSILLEDKTKSKFKE